MRTRITISDGDIISGRHGVRDMVRNCKDGDYALSITKWDRTLEQNRLYWKWLGVIGDELGYHKNEIHEVFLDMFSQIKTIRNLEGKPIQKRVRSSEMNVKQMSEYMDQIQQFASENSIILPQPDETP